MPFVILAHTSRRSNVNSDSNSNLYNVCALSFNFVFSFWFEWPIKCVWEGNEICNKKIVIALTLSWANEPVYIFKHRSNTLTAT